MAKRKKDAPLRLGDDILDRLRGLHKQATVERSLYYGDRYVSNINEITALRKKAGLSGFERNKRSRSGRPLA